MVAYIPTNQMSVMDKKHRLTHIFDFHLKECNILLFLDYYIRGCRTRAAFVRSLKGLSEINIFVNITTASITERLLEL